MRVAVRCAVCGAVVGSVGLAFLVHPVTVRDPDATIKGSVVLGVAGFVE